MQKRISRPHSWKTAGILMFHPIAASEIHWALPVKKLIEMQWNIGNLQYNIAQLWGQIKTLSMFSVISTIGE